MSSSNQDDLKVVRHFRQIRLCPLQLMPIREEAQIQEHWAPISVVRLLTAQVSLFEGLFSPVGRCCSRVTAATGM